MVDYQDKSNNICLFSRENWYPAMTFAHYHAHCMPINQSIKIKFRNK